MVEPFSFLCCRTPLVSLRITVPAPRRPDVPWGQSTGRSGEAYLAYQQDFPFLTLALPLPPVSLTGENFLPRPSSFCCLASSCDGEASPPFQCPQQVFSFLPPSWTSLPSWSVQIPTNGRPPWFDVSVSIVPCDQGVLMQKRQVRCLLRPYPETCLFFFLISLFRLFVAGRRREFRSFLAESEDFRIPLFRSRLW